MGDIINNDNLYFSSGEPFYRTSGALCLFFMRSGPLLFWLLIMVCLLQHCNSTACVAACVVIQVQERRRCSLLCWAREAWGRAR
jgi:hypothetical protein